MDPLRRIPIGRKLALARLLRREATPAERHAWSLLRNRRILGLKFRRQHVLRGFVVDFYCAELKLVVELDGGQHREGSQADYDAARSAWLESAGYQVIRIRNKDVNKARLKQPITQVVPPLPKGEGDRG